jgi:hypothetical protein
MNSVVAPIIDMGLESRGTSSISIKRQIGIKGYKVSVWSAGKCRIAFLHAIRITNFTLTAVADTLFAYLTWHSLVFPSNPLSRAMVIITVRLLMLQYIFYFPSSCLRWLHADINGVWSQWLEGTVNTLQRL